MGAGAQVTYGRRGVMAAVLAASLILAACGSAGGSSSNSQAQNVSPTSLYQDAKKGGALTWMGQFSESQATPIIQAFEKKYPGVQIKYSDVKPTEAMTQIQVQEHARNVQVDVAGVTGTNAPDLLNLKIIDDTLPWAKLGVPKDATAFNPGLVYDFAIGDFIVYNSAKVTSADAPKTWSALLDPKWQGKLAVDGRGAFLNSFYNSGQADQGLELAKKMAAQKPSYQANLEQVLSGVTSGQYAVGTAVISQVLTAQHAGKPVGIAPVSPVNMDQHWLYVPKAAPHRAAGELFVSWMASKEGQAALAQSYNSVLPLTTQCPGNGGAVVQSLCSNQIKWVTPKTVAQVKGESDYTKKVQKIFGTQVGG